MAAGFCTYWLDMPLRYWERKLTYWLLDFDVIGIDGHWLRGLDLLLDDGRHLSAVSVSA